MGAAGTPRPAKPERPPAGVRNPPALGRHALGSLRPCRRIGFRPSYFRLKEEPQSSNCFGSRFATFSLVGIWPFARTPAAGVIARQIKRISAAYDEFRKSWRKYEFPFEIE